MKINIVMGPFYPIPPIKGLAVEKRQYAMALEYAKAGHEVTMISRKYPGFADAETVDGVAHIRVSSFDAPKPGPLYRILDIIYSLRVSRRIPKADITVTNSVSAPLILPSKKAGKIAVSVGRYPKGQMRFYYRAARLHAPSKFIADAISEQSPAMAPKVVVVNNAIAHDFASAIEVKRGTRENCITYVGRITQEKGIDILIKSFSSIASQFKDWKLVLIGPWEISSGGDGATYLNELKELAKDFIDQIDFVGPIYDNKNLVARLKRSEIFVYPSIAEKGEAFGVAPVEAMACGCVLVVSALKCFQDFAEHGVNSVVFDHNVNAEVNLATALRKLIENGGMRAELAQMAVETAVRFTPSSISQKMLSDFERLVEHA